MESMEMPTPMSVNTPTQVTGGRDFSEETTNESIFSNENTQIQDTESAVSEIDTKEISTSERLLNSAKEDGFETALERLADGELDEQIQPLEGIDLEENEDSHLSNIDEVESIEGEIVEQEIEIPIREQIEALEEKVELLTKENKELLERAKNAENTNQANQEIMLALALALYELAKKEEDEDKKVGLLELIISMLTYFMTESLTEYHEDEGKKEEPKSHKKSSSSEEMDNVARIMQLMKERSRGLQSSQSGSQPTQTPHIEKVAA